jgi:antitoxin component YwqK of YwqJK toxin-antitoxin module
MKSTTLIRSLVIAGLPIVILFFSKSISAQTLNQKDKQGFKQGFWRKADSTGKIIYEGNFTDDKPRGEFKYFYEDGKVRNILHYSNTGTTAQSTSYYPQGGKMAEGTYINTKKDSTWRYFDEKGNLVSVEQYLRGLPTGTWRNFYPDGKLLEEYSFNESGLKEGQWKQYYNSGTIKLSAVYRSGKLQGETFYYYPDGSLLMQGNFKDELKVGAWLSFDETGKMVSRSNYDTNGHLIKTEYFDKQKEKELTAPETEIKEK